ncbi:rhodanese-like domain-containing protein [Terricaulis sp.]|uniref:MBL fold metallo-hydrolase n=1 Tax=Terricaulis sp. TaxID=2768686 RepID=UPI0037839BE1
MIFEQVATGGCQSYLVGCPDSCAAAVIDPEVRQIAKYQALAAQHGVRIRYVIDTHTHADHFSAAKQLGELLGVPMVAHRLSPAPYPNLRVDEGDVVKVGGIRLNVLYTPGHTRDAMCLVADDRVFTGDTLLIGATGRTDLPTGDPEQLYDSLFNKVLKLNPELRVYPAHDYKGRTCSTIAQELEANPRLQKRDKAEFVKMMRELSLSMPEHLNEALRVNMSGAVSVAQILSEAAAEVPFMTMAEVKSRVEGGANDLVVLDVREKDAFETSHIPHAMHLPRGQLELRVNEAFPDPTVRIVTYCDYGKISTLAAATLRRMGFTRAVALDGGMKAWKEQGFPVEGR